MDTINALYGLKYDSEDVDDDKSNEEEAHNLCSGIPWVGKL